MARNALMAAYNQSRRRKPPRNYGVTGAIPGYGGYQQNVQSQAVAQHAARYDRNVPQHLYAPPPQRAPYRPGEHFKRQHPYRYQRGDASRPHRPRWN